MMNPIENRSEIVFFDLEMTKPTSPSQGDRTLFEFGAIVVCPRSLTVLETYATLIRPDDLSKINSLTVRRKDIPREGVLSAPSFRDVADRVYDILHGRVWAGHYIEKFDCLRIKEAFDGIGKAAPEPKGTIDSWAILTQKFGRRAGDMKLASLAAYFGLGEPTHRSLDDVRMNFEVIKHCATVLFFESSLPNIFAANSWVPPNRGTLENEMETEIFQHGINMDEDKVTRSSEMLQQSSVLEGCSDVSGFVDPDELSIPSICVAPCPSSWGSQRLKILHNNVVLQIRCSRLIVRYGIKGEFTDRVGQPRLDFVGDASPSICRVLDAYDNAARKLSVDSGSDSEWRSVVMREKGYFNSLRLHLPAAVTGETAMSGLEIFQQDSSGATFNASNAGVPELVTLLSPGTSVDAYLSLEVYDYNRKAGINLMVKKLVIHSA